MLSLSTFTQKTIMYVWEMICFAVITLSRLNVQHHYQQSYRLYVLFSLFVYCMLHVHCTCTCIVEDQFKYNIYSLFVFYCRASHASTPLTAYEFRSLSFTIPNIHESVCMKVYKYFLTSWPTFILFHVIFSPVFMFSSEATYLVLKHVQNKTLYCIAKFMAESLMARCEQYLKTAKMSEIVPNGILAESLFVVSESFLEWVSLFVETERRFFSFSNFITSAEDK